MSAEKSASGLVIVAFFSLALAGAAACASDDAGDASSPSSDAGAGGRGAGGGGSGAAGSGGDGGGGGAPGKPDCNVGLAGPSVRLTAAEGATGFPRFAWSGSGFVGARMGPGGLGLELSELSADGELLAPPRTLWPEERTSETVKLAVAGSVVALVGQRGELDDQRQTCWLALAELGGGSALRAPARFSDAPELESIVNEASGCSVAATDSEIVVAWRQNVSRTAMDWALYAQRFDLSSTPVGERLTLATGDDKTWGPEVSATALGNATVVAYAGRLDGAIALAFIEGDSVRTVTLPPGSRVPSLGAIRAAHGGLMLSGPGAVALLDAQGTVLAGSEGAVAGAVFAPLAGGYLTAGHDEYLVAIALDESLELRSNPTGLSLDRRASLDDVVFAPDGSATAALYREGRELRFQRLACTDKPPAPLGPQPCPTSDEVAPLDPGCEGAVCHVVLRLDYQTLGLLGWATRSGAASPVDATGADVAASAVFDANGEYLTGQIEMSGPELGLYRAYHSPGDFGAFALVSQASGVVVTAGGVVWSGRGLYWVPADWNPATSLACDRTGRTPAATWVDPSTCPGFEPGAPPAPDGNAALAVALRTNLARHMTDAGAFTAYVYLYTPTVGACDPGVAEWVVVLGREE